MMPPNWWFLLLIAVGVLAPIGYGIYEAEHALSREERKQIRWNMRMIKRALRKGEFATAEYGSKFMLSGEIHNMNPRSGDRDGTTSLQDHS